MSVGVRSYRKKVIDRILQFRRHYISVNDGERLGWSKAEARETTFKQLQQKIIVLMIAKNFFTLIPPKLILFSTGYYRATALIC